KKLDFPGRSGSASPAPKNLQRAFTGFVIFSGARRSRLLRITLPIGGVAFVGCDKRSAVAPSPRQAWCDCASLVTPYGIGFLRINSVRRISKEVNRSRPGRSER